MNAVYYDLRSGEFRKENDDGLLPPELYYMYVAGTEEDVVVECYLIQGNKNLDYAYSLSYQKEVGRKTK